MNDLHNCAMYCANGVICNYFDAGRRPTIQELRENWHAHTYKMITDEQLRNLIDRVERFYK